MDEIAAVDIYLDSVLGSYAPLRSLIPNVTSREWLFSRLADEDAIFPYIVFSYNSDLPVIAIGGGLQRIQTTLNYTIITSDDTNDLIPSSNILKQIEAAISATNSQLVTVDGDTVVVQIMQKINSMNYFELDAGKRINYYGGVYQFFVASN
jgi:hypothetical protein